MSPGTRSQTSVSITPRVDDLRRTGVPQSLGDAGPGLVDACRQQRQEDHHRQADVQAPEGGLQEPVGMQRPVVQAAQAEQHQADAQHAVDAEERRMAVGRRHVQALHVVQRCGRIDGEAEQPGADRVPEAHGDEREDRPTCRRRARPRSSSGGRSAALPGRSASAARLPAPRTRRRRRSPRSACPSSTGGAACRGCRRTGTRWSRRRWHGWRMPRGPDPGW